MCCFALCMFDCWKMKTLHDATFSATDIYHKLFDVLYVCTVASAALFISPISLMKNFNNGYLFGFVVSLSLNSGNEPYDSFYFVFT